MSGLAPNHDAIRATWLDDLGRERAQLWDQLTRLLACDEVVDGQWLALHEPRGGAYVRGRH